MRARTGLILWGTALLLGSAGCQSHLPPLQTVPYAGHVTPADITADINCELATIVAVGTQTDVPKAISDALADPRSSGRSDAHRKTLQRLQELFSSSNAPAKSGADLTALLKRLTEDHFVAAVQLTLDVTDSEGFAPSLSKVSPYLKGMNNRTLSLGGQLNGTQDRTVTLTNSIDFEALVATPTWNPVEFFCRKVKSDTGAALGTATGMNGALLGDLGLADIVVDGLRSLDDSSKVNLYGGTGPTRPVETATVQFNLEHMHPTATTPPPMDLSSGSLDGSVTFTPPAPGTYTPETATLVGVLKLRKVSGAEAISYLVNIPGTVMPEPPDRNTYLLNSTGHRVRLSFQGTLSADTTNPDLGTPGMGPTLFLAGASATGKLNDLALKGQISAPTGFASFSFDASIFEGSEHLRNSKYTSSFSLQGLNTPLTAISALSSGTSSGGTGGGKSAGAGGGSTNGSTSFGSTVNFTLSYGLNGGANWTLTHFKGPSPTSPLLTGSRTETNTLNITFVPACRTVTPSENIDLIAPKLSSFWDILSPCDADNVNVGNAAAAANQLNLLLRLH